MRHQCGKGNDSGTRSASYGCLTIGRNTMQSKLLHDAHGQRTFAVILSTGDEVMTCLKQFITQQKITAAQISAIGALSDAVLLYFDWDKKDYMKIPVHEQVEVASLL